MRPTILIVDDDRLTCEIMHEVILMHYSTWRIVCTSDGTDAVVLANSLRPNLILLNSHVSPMSCDEIAVNLRASLVSYNIPLVLMKDDASSEPGLAHPWCCAQLEKPFSLHSLYEVLDKFVQPIGATTVAGGRHAAGSHLLAPGWLSTPPRQAPVAAGADASLSSF
jgi:DNA-binding response OmpR family regulator